MYSSFSIQRRRPTGPPPSWSQIITVASDVVSTLRSAGVDACFVGGMACRLLGASRQPNDLDILCLNAGSQEGLKARLVALNSSFYLVPSRDPTATYKVLWYHISTTDSCLKVDLLVPGVLDIPYIPPSTIDYGNTFKLPCAPFSLVLLLKLQAWIHHGESVLSRFRLKRPTDARDINELLSIAYHHNLHPRTESYLPESFVSRAELRVEKYVESHSETKKLWETLGFTFAPQPEPRKPQRSSSGAHARYPGGRKVIKF